LFYDSKSEKEMEPLDKLDPLYLKTENVEADLPLDEVIQTLEAPAQEGLNKVSYFPFQICNDDLSYELESKEVLDVFNPSCYDEDDDFVDNIDEFIHVRKRKWDMMGIPFTTLRVIPKSCLCIYHMKLLIILAFGNKNLTLFKHPRMT
jgi:hypothetical protein